MGLLYRCSMFFAPPITAPGLSSDDQNQAQVGDERGASRLVLGCRTSEPAYVLVNNRRRDFYGQITVIPILAGSQFDRPASIVGAQS